MKPLENNNNDQLVIIKPNLIKAIYCFSHFQASDQPSWHSKLNGAGSGGSVANGGGAGAVIVPNGSSGGGGSGGAGTIPTVAPGDEKALVLAPTPDQMMLATIDSNNAPSSPDGNSNAGNNTNDNTQVARNNGK